MTDDGYGVSYIISSDATVSFHITSKLSSEKTVRPLPCLLVLANEEGVTVCFPPFAAYDKCLLTVFLSLSLPTTSLSLSSPYSCHHHQDSSRFLKHIVQAMKDIRTLFES